MINSYTIRDMKPGVSNGHLKKDIHSYKKNCLILSLLYKKSSLFQADFKSILGFFRVYLELIRPS